MGGYDSESATFFHHSGGQAGFPGLGGVPGALGESFVVAGAAGDETSQEEAQQEGGPAAGGAEFVTD